MRRDFVSEEAAPEEAPPAPAPTAYPPYPAPQRTGASVIHQKAAQGELLWVKAALDAGADIGDREGLVRPARARPARRERTPNDAAPSPPPLPAATPPPRGKRARPGRRQGRRLPARRPAFALRRLWARCGV